MQVLFSVKKGLALALVAGVMHAPTQSQAQVAPAESLSTDFNSTFSLSSAQVAAAQLTNEITKSINVIIRGERSGLANGGPRQDDFYTLPPHNDTKPLASGQVLKIQKITNNTAFAIAPGSTLSRILYTSETVNGTVVPASAYILWPFEARQFGADKLSPVVLWTHGTTGFFADAAPSSYRSLQYGDTMPFTLAKAGYTVVAPDYTGLGVGKSWDGSDIPHQYLMGPSGARDAIYALQAARTAFSPRLNGKFAVVGHSQGGGVAWSTAEYLATLQQKAKSLSQTLQDTIKSYVGTVAMAPVTDAWTVGTFGTAAAGLGVKSIFPDFKLNDWFTSIGSERLQLLKDVQGSSSVAQQLFLSEPQDTFLKPDWNTSTYHAAAFAKLGNAGGKPFAGPMMVTQGTKDVFVAESRTAAAANKSIEANPGNSLTYVVVDGYGHTPAVQTLTLTWMRWLEDRFEGKSAKPGLARLEKKGAEGSAQTENAFPLYAAEAAYFYLNVALV